MSLKTYLDNNASYPAISTTGGRNMTGSTGTNVNDLMVRLVDK